MPEVRAQLIISARDEATAVMQGVGQSTQNVGTQTKETSLKFTELYSAVRLAEMGLRVVKDAYDQTVGPTLKLADSVRNLSEMTGISAEESSKLVYAANVTGVSVTSLETAIKASIRTLQSHKSAGIEPNIEGLAQLSDRYLAIQDPILRTKFLMDNFGRSGADMQELMQLGSNGIKQLGDQASAAGVVMSGPAVDAAYKYEQSIHKLDAAFLGLKVSIGEKIIPVLSSVADAMNENITLQDRITQAQQLGIDTSKIVNYTYQDGLKIITNTKEANYELGLAIDAKRAAGQSDNIVMANNILLHQQEAEVVKEEADKYYELQHSIWLASNAHDAATIKTYAAIQVERERLNAQKDAIEDQRLQAYMSNVIDSAQKSYLDTVKASQPEIDKLTQQIADMTAANGMEITTVVKGTYSQEDFNIATERAALAQDKYQAALQGTVDKHGKLHKANDLTLEGLRIAAEAAQNQVDKMEKKMGSSTTTTADYTNALKDAKDKLSDLQQKEKDAYDQVMKTTGQFILQQLALDMKLEPAMKLQMMHALGLVNEKEYELGQTVLGATKLFDFNKNGMIDNGIEADALAKYLADLQTQAVTTSDEGIAPLTAHASDATGKLADMKQAAIDAQTALSNIKDKSVTITTNHVDNYYTNRHGPDQAGYAGEGGSNQYGNAGPAGGGGTGGTTGGGAGHGAQEGQAAGGDYVVTGPRWFLAGEAGPERATFTPLGRAGPSDPALVALLNNLPAMMSRAVRDAIRR